MRGPALPSPTLPLPLPHKAEAVVGNVVRVVARINGGEPHTFKGRVAWCLHALALAGERGVTPIERPAPRWSHYVWCLRGEGVAVETIHEGHAGAYSGTHARYVLRCPVEILGTETKP
jgi:hypothetical protein